LLWLAFAPHVVVMAHRVGLVKTFGRWLVFAGPVGQALADLALAVAG
jgi:hypothetical protein